MSVPLKYAEFVAYAVDFAGGNGSAGPLLY